MKAKEGMIMKWIVVAVTTMIVLFIVEKIVGGEHLLPFLIGFSSASFASEVIKMIAVKSNSDIRPEK